MCHLYYQGGKNQLGATLAVTSKIHKTHMITQQKKAFFIVIAMDFSTYIALTGWAL
jgi:hypothetical protein